MTEQPPTRPRAPHPRAGPSLSLMPLPGGEHRLEAKCLANRSRRVFLHRESCRKRGRGSRGTLGPMEGQSLEIKEPICAKWFSNQGTAGSRKL